MVKENLDIVKVERIMNLNEIIELTYEERSMLDSNYDVIYIGRYTRNGDTYLVYLHNNIKYRTKIN